MDQQTESLLNDVEKLVPSVKKHEIEYFAFQVSQRSGISIATLLITLYEDLRSGVPFNYTSVGKCRSMVRL